MKKYTATDFNGRRLEGDQIDYEGFSAWLTIFKQGGFDKIRVQPDSIREREVTHEND